MYVMTQPATGETTSASTKCQRTTLPSVAVTPGDSILYITAALQAANNDVAAEAAIAIDGMDAK
jgi:hypothetical protein